MRWYLIKCGGKMIMAGSFHFDHDSTGRYHDNYYGIYLTREYTMCIFDADKHMRTFVLQSGVEIVWGDCLTWENLGGWVYAVKYIKKLEKEKKTPNGRQLEV